MVRYTGFACRVASRRWETLGDVVLFAPVGCLAPDSARRDKLGALLFAVAGCFAPDSTALCFRTLTLTLCFRALARTGRGAGCCTTGFDGCTKVEVTASAAVARCWCHSGAAISRGMKHTNGRNQGSETLCVRSAAASPSAMQTGADERSKFERG